MNENDKYCAALVREADRDRYLAALFAPADRRGALFSLYAFDIEISRIRDLAREPMPGEIRLQWWREVLEGVRAGERRQIRSRAPACDAGAAPPARGKAH
jgi:phytoene synthase